MDYKQKLIEWNSTPKYFRELAFLLGLIGGGHEGRILDFGCGVLTALKYLSLKTNHFIYGYDVQEYGEQEDYHLYDRELNKKYDVIYFMHVLAHLSKPLETLESLRCNLSETGRLIIITPNADWLDKDYVGDTTVIRHYNLQTLTKLVTDAGYSVHQTGQFGDIKNNINERIFVVAK